MCNTPEDLDLQGIDTVAIDIETYDPNLKTKGLGAVRGDGFITGVAVATGKDTVYFPLHHSDVKKSEEEQKEFWDAINNKLLQNKDITKVFHNAMYDICWIRAVTGKMVKGRVVDTMIAASVIDENKFKYSLDALSKEYLNDGKYKYDLQEKVLKDSNGTIKDAMSNMHRIDSNIVKEYAKQDVSLTLKLWNIFDKKLDEVLYTKPDTKEEKTCRNIFELETRLFPCLVDMKFKGVRIDVQKLESFGKKLKHRRDNLLNIIKKHTGVSVQIWAANSIKVLLQQQKITNYEKTPKSGMPKLPKDYLKTHANRFLRHVGKARECDKALNTFIEGLKGYVHNGRIHADINQIRSDTGGTVTGRFSMSNPNLQQIPAKGYYGKKMREMFLPEEGCEWASFDYSQQEPRIVAHYAASTNNGFTGSKEFIEAYKNESADFHQIVADMAQITRTQAKTINLGLFYGMGKAKLAKELGISKDRAEQLLIKYGERVPFVKQLATDVSSSASKYGFIRTIRGRKCRFDMWEPSTFGMNKAMQYEEAKAVYGNNIRRAFTYKALNRLIQGSAADQTKQAMIDCYKAGYKPILQIHDELCFSIDKEPDIKNVKEIMENAITDFKVPSKVDVALGKSWGEAKE